MPWLPLFLDDYWFHLSRVLPAAPPPPALIISSAAARLPCAAEQTPYIAFSDAAAAQLLPASAHMR